jgi:RNase P subunit RPR2
MKPTKKNLVRSEESYAYVVTCLSCGAEHTVDINQPATLLCADCQDILAAADEAEHRR